MNQDEEITLAQGVTTCSDYTGTVWPQLHVYMHAEKPRNSIDILMYLRHLSILSMSSVVLILSFIFQQFFRDYFWHLPFDSLLDP